MCKPACGDGALDKARKTADLLSMTSNAPKMPETGAATQTPDVVIVGGGVVGLTQAVALADGGISVTVIDAADPAEAKGTGFDGRAFAVAYSSQLMLQTLGVWDHLGGRTQAINDILVTDGKPGSRFARGGPSPFFLHFDHRDLAASDGGAPLGSMVEARHARAALYDRINEMPGVDLKAPDHVDKVTFDSNGADIVLRSGTKLRTSLVIGADGRFSKLRDQAGIKTVGWTYDQHGLVTTIAHERPHEGVAQEYFLPSGPFAILPITDNRSSLVWTERADLAPAFMALDDEAFTAEIRKRCGAYLGAIDIVGPRFSYPLGLQVARDLVAPRLALIGDAAHAIHPISGQGWNLGLKDVAALAEILIEAKRLGMDLGSADLLDTYQQWRRFDITALAAITDGLNRLFSTDFTPLALARDIGMQAINQMGPLKKLFMHHAAGAVGTLPKLLTGERV